jgi:hypothetical protein
MTSLDLAAATAPLHPDVTFDTHCESTFSEEEEEQFDEYFIKRMPPRSQLQACSRQYKISCADFATVFEERIRVPSKCYNYKELVSIVKQHLSLAVDGKFVWNDTAILQLQQVYEHAGDVLFHLGTIQRVSEEIDFISSTLCYAGASLSFLEETKGVLDTRQALVDVFQLSDNIDAAIFFLQGEESRKASVRTILQKFNRSAMTASDFSILLKRLTLLEKCLEDLFLHKLEYVTNVQALQNAMQLAFTILEDADYKKPEDEDDSSAAEEEPQGHRTCKRQRDTEEDLESNPKRQAL